MTTSQQKHEDVRRETEKALNQLSTSPQLQPSKLREQQARLDREEELMRLSDEKRMERFQRHKAKFTTGRKAAIWATKLKLKYAQEKTKVQGKADRD